MKLTPLVAIDSNSIARSNYKMCNLHCISHTHVSFNKMKLYKSNTTGTTCWAGTVYPFGAPEFISDYKRGSCCSIFSFCVVFWTSLFVLFLLLILLSVFRFTAFFLLSICYLQTFLVVRYIFTYLPSWAYLFKFLFNRPYASAGIWLYHFQFFKLIEIT